MTNTRASTRCVAPRTLTSADQELILRMTAPAIRGTTRSSRSPSGPASGSPRSSAWMSGTCFTPTGRRASGFTCEPRSRRAGGPATLFLPDRLGPKLARLWAYKVERGESLAPDAPLFCNQSGTRISKRRVQVTWHGWQRTAGFNRAYSFHALRHSAVTNVYRASRDLFLAQRFARHASPLTTVVYTHPSDEELAAQVRGLGC